MSGWRDSTMVIYLLPSGEKHRPYFLLPSLRSTSSLVLAAYGAGWMEKVEVAGSSFPPSFSGGQAEGQGDCPPSVSCMLSAPAVCQAVPGRPRLLSVTLLASSCPSPPAP